MPPGMATKPLLKDETVKFLFQPATIYGARSKGTQTAYSTDMNSLSSTSTANIMKEPRRIRKLSGKWWLDSGTIIQKALPVPNDNSRDIHTLTIRQSSGSTHLLSPSLSHPIRLSAPLLCSTSCLISSTRCSREKSHEYCISHENMKQPLKNMRSYSDSDRLW